MERENLLLEELKKKKYLNCSDEMLKKMYELVEFEKGWWWKCNRKPKRVPDKKGFIFTNKKEIEQVRQENAALLRDQEIGKEKYPAMLADLMKEKEKNHITEKLFFQAPLEKDINEFEIGRFRNNEASSLYGFGKTQNDISDLAYSIGAGRTGLKDMVTLLFGEAFLYIYDRNHNFICGKNPKGEGEQLYFDSLNYTSAKCKYEDFMQVLVDQEYMCLYSDLELIEENQGKEFEVQYIWDFENKAIYGYDNIVALRDEKGWKSADENIEAYFSNAKKMTDFYVKTCEGVASYRDYVVKWPNEEYCHTDVEGCCYEIFVRKKALVFSYEGNIAAIMIPKVETEVLNIRGDKKAFISTTTEKYNKHYCIKEIISNPGTNWEHYVATTMHYAAYTLKNKMKPMDLRERKPDELSNKLWRLWIRMRLY